MRLKRLEAEHYRNISHAVLEPGPELTVICGENGQGKTNLLEAVWLLTGSKSFRGAKDAELIAQNEPVARLLGETESDGMEKKIRVTVAGAQPGMKKGRTAQVNGVDYGRATAIAGIFTAVVFEPGHLTLVKGSPEGRRRFLDAALCQLYPGYLSVFRRYYRQLTQKNALLKLYHKTQGASALLDVFDEELARLGEQMMHRRQEYLAVICPEIYRTYHDISGGREALRVEYRPTCAKGQLLDTLLQNRRRDVAAGFCTAGPHREDFELFLDDRPAKIYASQGQQRSIVLSMKLAEAAGTKEITGEHPVMLLDDVLSELDENRQRYLLSRMEHRQTLVTACDTAAFARTDGRIYRMHDGVLSPG